MPLALALTVGLVPVGARDAAQLQTTPKRSPGEIALLANAPEHKADSDLKGALLDPDPRVRSVAARTIAVVPHGELYPDVVGALAREQDAAAAAELARDVLYLGRAANMPLVLTVAKRFGPAIAPVVAEWSGRIQAAQLLQLLPELTTLAGARANQLTGIIINTTISRTGCVRDERVVRGIPYLDVAAVTAVSQWTFEPTRIAGTPVPTIMNVTVNFELR